MGRSSGNPEQAQQASAQFLKIKEEAGKHFKQALFYLTDNRKDAARQEFDYSVEAFLISTVDVQRNEGLSQCFNLLIESINRLEIPTEANPNIRTLSDICGWNIDPKLADEISKINDKKPTRTRIANGKNQSQTESDFEGFTNQQFSNSPLDELSKLRLDQNKNTVPVPAKTQNNVMVVKAQQGDTVETLAKRHGANAVEIAKFNGLFVNSKLGNGREIRIPTDKPVSSDTFSYNAPKPKIIDNSGTPPPTQLKNGTVPSVMNWFNEYANDPYSLKVVRWGKVRETYVNEYKVWAVCVKFRAKNSYNAYVLSSMNFYFSKGKVISTKQITDCLD